MNEVQSIGHLRIDCNLVTRWVISLSKSLQIKNESNKEPRVIATFKPGWSRIHKADQKGIQRSRRKTKGVWHYGNWGRWGLKKENMVNTGMSGRNWNLETRFSIRFSNKNLSDDTDDDKNVNDNHAPTDHPTLCTMHCSKLFTYLFNTQENLAN